MIPIAPFLNGLPRSIDHDCKKLGELVVVDVGVGEGDCIFEGVLEVDIAGGREVELIGVCELHVLGLITCVGCDIVKGDHAPDGGVAQGVIHGQAPWQESGRGGRRTWAGGEKTGGRRRSNNHVHMHGWDGVTRH